MQEVVTAPFIFFLTSILFGMGLLCIYDVIRAFRKVFFHKPLFVIIEDCLYALCVAVTSFVFLCTYNYGELRGFFFMGIVIGMSIYYMKISCHMMKVVIYFFSVINYFLKTVYQGITRPMICIQRNIKWRLKKEKKNVTMALKKQIKRGDQSGTKEKTK